MVGHIDIQLQPKPVKVFLSGTLVAETTQAQELREGQYPVRYYIPVEDIRTDYFKSSSHHTHCPFKGDASYWTAAMDGRTFENIAFSYPQPKPGADRIQGMWSFYNENKDVKIEVSG